MGVVAAGRSTNQRRRRGASSNHVSRRVTGETDRRLVHRAGPGRSRGAGQFPARAARENRLGDVQIMDAATRGEGGRSLTSLRVVLLLARARACAVPARGDAHAHWAGARREFTHTGSSCVASNDAGSTRRLTGPSLIPSLFVLINSPCGVCYASTVFGLSRREVLRAPEDAVVALKSLSDVERVRS